LIFLLASISLSAQQPLEIAREQMLAGRTADARRLVASELSGGSELARLMEAVLTARGDSAAALLESVARQGGHGLASALAAERMGDVLFAAGRWEDAAKWWDFALSVTADKPGQNRLAIKYARADYVGGRLKQALSRLDKVAGSADTPLAGEARYWSGVVLERQGKTRDAAEEYMAAYTSPGNRMSLAALHRLHAFYGNSSGSNAADWRERWNRASTGSVFDSRYLPSPAPAQTASPAATVSSGKSSGWILQLGAFSSRQRAADHVARIKRLGLNPVLEPPQADKLYRVRIEGIPDEKELKRISALLKKNKFDYHVIQP
jgi:tetratricopeptide (TPR) repeat protein